MSYKCKVSSTTKNSLSTNKSSHGSNQMWVIWNSNSTFCVAKKIYTEFLQHVEIDCDDPVNNLLLTFVDNMKLVNETRTRLAVFPSTRNVLQASGGVESVRRTSRGTKQIVTRQRGVQSAPILAE